MMMNDKSGRLSLKILLLVGGFILLAMGTEIYSIIVIRDTLLIISAFFVLMLVMETYIIMLIVHEIWDRFRSSRYVGLSIGEELP